MNYELNYVAPPTIAKFMRSDAFFRAIKGAVGSGKSVGCAIEEGRQAIIMPPCKDGVRRSRHVIVRNCYDDETEILVEGEGWVLFKDLDPEDKVATRVNGKLTFEKPSYHYAAPYEGRMITIVGESIDLCVTPDHELWVSPRRTRKKIWHPYEHIKAQDIEGIGELYRMASTCDWEGTPTDDSEDWYEFLGFWFAQGYAGVYPRTDTIGYHYRLILTHRENDRAYVEDLLERVGLKYGVSKKPGCYDFRIATTDQEVKDVIAELAQYGKAITKWIPQYIKDAPKGHIRAFLYGFQRGDGVFKTDKHNVDRLYSSSPRLINDLHELIIKSGRSAYLAQHTQPGIMQISKDSPIYNTSGGYTLTLRQDLREDPIIRKHFWGEKQYTGMVYCVTVSSHVVLVRRNGKAVWCGQTRQQLKDTTLRTFLDWWKPGVFGRWKESEMIFEMRFKDVEADFLFRPLDSAEDVQRVLSLEATSFWLNEAREIPIEILQAAMSRVGRYPKREDVPEYRSFVLADTNPPEVDSLWYKIFERLPLEEDNPDSVVEVDTFKQPSGTSPEAENVENLRKNYYQDLARGKTKAWVDTYVHGLYSPSLSGKPVYSSSFKPERHISPVPLKIDPILPVVIGFDTGLTPAAGFLQMGLDGRVRILREAAVFDMGMERFAKFHLRPLIKNFFPNNPLIFIGDPAGKRRADSDESTAFKTLKEVFEADDVVVKAAATNDPDVRIQALEKLFCQYPDGEPMVLIDPSCKRFIDGVRSKYRYPKMKQTGTYADRPEKNDFGHLVEGTQYGALYLLSGKYDPSDHVRVNTYGPLNQPSYYRPAQREGY